MRNTWCDPSNKALYSSISNCFWFLDIAIMHCVNRSNKKSLLVSKKGNEFSYTSMRRTINSQITENLMPYIGTYQVFHHRL
jgi:hypothetical protein